MSFHRCSYKNSWFSELACNSSVCSLKFRKDIFLKNVAWDFVLLLLVLKLYPIQVVISLPLWVKLTMGQLILFFLWNLSSFFSLSRCVLGINLFSQFVADRYILAIQQIITHEEHLRYSFWSVAIFWTASEALAPWS